MSPDLTPVSHEEELAPSAPRGRKPLTRREKRRRIVMLTMLLLLLALLAYASYYFIQNRRLPTVDFMPEPVELVNPPRFLYAITGQGANQLERPVGVAVKDGRVYVADHGQDRVAVFRENGSFLFAFNKVDGGKTLKRPSVIAIRGDEVWVTDRVNRQLYVFGLDGSFKRVFKPANETISPWAPLAIAFGPDGEIVISDVGDTRRHKVHFFSAEGSRTASVGRTVQANAVEEEPGGFLFPSSLAIADDGRVYVSDGNNRRVQVFTLDGAFSAFVDTSGIPRGSVVDSEDRLYVADALAHNVDVYDLNGKRLTQFGGQGFGPGQFNYPGYVALNEDTRIFISDRENNQVQVWGWPQAEPPAIAAPTSPLGWLACLLPFLLLPLLLLLRKIRIVVTPDFVDALVASGDIVAVSNHRRLRLVCPESDGPAYAGRVVDGVDLGQLVTPEPYSESDVRTLIERLEMAERDAVLISMAAREKGLATLDRDLRRVAVLAEVNVVDMAEFRERFLKAGK